MIQLIYFQKDLHKIFVLIREIRVCEIRVCEICVSLYFI